MEESRSGPQSRFSPFVWSMLIAVLVVVGLAVTMVIVMLLGRGNDAVEAPQSANDDTPDAVNCTFTGLAGQLMVYAAPVNAVSQQQVSVLGSENYPVIKRQRGFYLIELPSGDTGWALGQDGTLQGEECDDIPEDDTPLSEFPSVCTVVTEEEAPLYSEAALANAAGTLEPGTYYVESISGQSYYIVQTDGSSGWLQAAAGQLVGACDALANPPQ